MNLYTNDERKKKKRIDRGIEQPSVSAIVFELEEDPLFVFVVSTETYTYRMQKYKQNSRLMFTFCDQKSSVSN